MILDKFKLDGKVAIVTGGARGLGQAMAVALAEAGADIALVDILDMKETAESITGLGKKCVTLHADLSSNECIDSIVKTVTSKLGSIDILLNNAGIIRRAEFTEFTEKDWDDVMNINLRTVFFLSQAVVKVMLEQGRGGKIINIASMLSFQGGILIPSYTASKSAVMGLTKLMANELARHNINVNAIAPGYIEGEGNRAIREDPKRNMEILNRISAGKWGKPKELMGTIVYLASDASEYVHGYTIAVDGGWLAR